MPCVPVFSLTHLCPLDKGNTKHRIFQRCRAAHCKRASARSKARDSAAVGTGLQQKLLEVSNAVGLRHEDASRVLRLLRWSDGD